MYIICSMLTKKQKNLLLFINKKIRSSGISPSYEEMKQSLSLKSKSGIHRLITSLEQRGFIKRLKHKARAMQIIKKLCTYILFILIFGSLPSLTYAQDNIERDTLIPIEFERQIFIYGKAKKYNDRMMQLSTLYSLLAYNPNNSAILDSIALVYFEVQQYVSAALVGIGAGPMWVSQGMYMSALSSKYGRLIIKHGNLHNLQEDYNGLFQGYFFGK